MTLTLKLRFYTRPGQSLFVTGNHPLLGEGDLDRAVPLNYAEPEAWMVTLDVPDPAVIPETGVVYSYVLRNSDGSIITDGGRDRFLSRELLSRKDVLIIDSWNSPGFPENAFYTEPFARVLLRANATEFRGWDAARVTHEFRVKAPLLGPGQTLCLLGGAAELGHWDPSRAVVLSRPRDGTLLMGKLDLSGAAFPIEYKYGIYDLSRRSFVRYEEGGNRRVQDGPRSQGSVILNDGFVLMPTDWKAAGVALPVFSLRSPAGCGVGEFPDLKGLADWCAETGLKLIQILPINDTTATHTWVDSYPYAAISTFALHPIYLNLDAVVSERSRGMLKEIESERTRLNALPEVDYEGVMRVKWKFLRSAYQREKAATFSSDAYQKFHLENRDWLGPYAVFCGLRDRYGTADFNQWPAHRRCTREDIQAMTDPDSREFDEIGLHYFVQFHLHRQLEEAAAYAHSKGVILKGDIAIGVARHGSDTWQNPELFHLEMQAGAPPDPFSDKGQNWGFPTYNWPRMKQDGFEWWKRRFAQMGHYFDAFRIDHILGFFRIWSVPMDAVEGILGHFVPALPVTRDEITSRGIDVIDSRFVEPFIDDQILELTFGPRSDEVRREFLLKKDSGGYRLKPEFATQRQIENFLASNPRHHELQPGLFDLISNVILFEADASGERFHFRFDVEKTASFQALDSRAQSVLRALYVDYFYRRQDTFWEGEAMQKLPVLKGVTDMLICGEDLGLVPGCVPGVMKALGLLSLEIQRMPKTPGVAFSRPSAAPYLSVVTASTHDMSTIRGWWREDPVMTQRFYNEELHRPGPAPEECTGEINQAIVEMHLASPAMWSIFQLQDWLGMDESLRRSDVESERINVPANPKHYWRYRMHLTFDELMARKDFNMRIRRLLWQHGR